TESIHAVFVCTAFDSLPRWLDTTANIKAILLSELVFDKIMEEGLVQQIQEANYLLQSVLYGIQELGEHEPNLSSLLSFGVHVYEELRHCFEIFNQHLCHLLLVINKVFENLMKLSLRLQKNIGQRHKKVVVIKDLPPLIRLKQKEDSSLLDIEPNDNIGLCNLFSDNQNSC
ncbi:exportin-5, partial [Caerostris extrusa]